MLDVCIERKNKIVRSLELQVMEIKKEIYI